MLTLLVFALLTGSLSEGGSLPPPIENCDGSGQKFYSGLTQPDGGEWFSLKGRILDPDGNPVCGAWVSVEYLIEVSSEWGMIRGPVSPSGLTGDFFLATIRKGKPFRVLVNPFSSVEKRALFEGLDSIDSFLRTQHNVRTAKLARYTSEEMRSATSAGVVTMDITLKEDATATGVLMGSVGMEGPFDTDSPAMVSIVISGRESIEVPIDRRTGSFVAFGVPVGQHEVKAEVSSKRHKHTLIKTVVIPPGANATVRVSLTEK